MQFVLLMSGVFILYALLRTHHGPLHFLKFFFFHFRTEVSPAVLTKL